MCGWTMVDFWSISGRDMAKLMAQIVTSGGIRMDSGGIRLDYSAAKELILDDETMRRIDEIDELIPTPLKEDGLRRK